VLFRSEQVWKDQHQALKDARDAWLEELQAKIEEGRQEWRDRFAEFDESRALAEQELDRYMLEERARREAAISQLGDMVRGGGAALLEA